MGPQAVAPAPPGHDKLRIDHKCRCPCDAMQRRLPGADELTPRDDEKHSWRFPIFWRRSINCSRKSGSIAVTIVGSFLVQAVLGSKTSGDRSSLKLNRELGRAAYFLEPCAIVLHRRIISQSGSHFAKDVRSVRDQAGPRGDSESTCRRDAPRQLPRAADKQDAAISLADLFSTPQQKNTRTPRRRPSDLSVAIELCLPVL